MTGGTCLGNIAIQRNQPTGFTGQEPIQQQREGDKAGSAIYAKSWASACAAASISAAANTPETTAMPSAPASMT
jgi:hypothetical protein